MKTYIAHIPISNEVSTLGSIDSVVLVSISTGIWTSSSFLGVWGLVTRGFFTTGAFGLSWVSNELETLDL